MLALFGSWGSSVRSASGGVERLDDFFLVAGSTSISLSLALANCCSNGAQVISSASGARQKVEPAVSLLSRFQSPFQNPETLAPFFFAFD